MFKYGVSAGLTIEIMMGTERGLFVRSCGYSGEAFLKFQTKHCASGEPHDTRLSFFFAWKRIVNSGKNYGTLGGWAK